MEIFQKNSSTVKLIEKFDQGKYTYIVTKHASGGDLFDHCMRQPD